MMHAGADLSARRLPDRCLTRCVLEEPGGLSSDPARYCISGRVIVGGMP